MKLKQYLKGLGLGIIVTAVVLGISSNGKNREISDEAVRQRAKELGMIENTVLSETDHTAEGSDPSYAEEAYTTAEDSVSMADPNTAAQEYSSTDYVDTMAQEYVSTDYVDTMAQEYVSTDDVNTMAQESVSTDDRNTMAQESVSTDDRNTTAQESVSADNTNHTDTTAQESADQQEVSPEEAAPEPVIVDPTPGQNTETGLFIIQIGETPYSISRRLYEGGWVSSTEEFKKHLVNNGYDTWIVAAAYHIPVGADMDQIAQMITQYRTVRNR